MRRTAWVLTAAVTAAVVVGGARIMGADGQENSDRGRGKQCSEATVRGDYGIQIQGTRPAPGGLTESVIGIVLRNYDGHGSFSQVSNVKGSMTSLPRLPSTRATSVAQRISSPSDVVRCERPHAISAMASRRLVLPAAFGPHTSCGPGPNSTSSE